MQARWSYLNKSNFDPEIWMRYGQLLAAAEPISSTTKSAPGTNHVPSWLRKILYQFLYLHSFYGFREKNSPPLEEKFSIDNLYALASADKSSTEESIKVDVIDCLYHQDNSWGRVKFNDIT